MTEKDLLKVDSLIERYKKLPKTADLKVKVLSGKATDLEKKESMEIIAEIDNIFAEIWAFVKVKYGKDSGYLRRSAEISFAPRIGQHTIVTTNMESYRSSWLTAMREFEHLLSDLRLETKTIIEHKNDQVNDKLEADTSKQNTTTITNSNVVVGAVSHSDLSREKGNVNPATSPSKKNKQKNISVIINILKWLIPVGISAGILYFAWLRSK